MNSNSSARSTIVSVTRYQTTVSLPDFNGSTTETNLPTQWSKTEGLAWTTALPGYSGATPVIWEESVFVSSPDEQKNLYCVRRPR